MMFSNSRTKHFLAQYGNVFSLFVLTSLAIFVCLWHLGQGSLEGIDEAIYSEVSKEIVNGNEWLTLHWNFEPWFHKSPLYFWITGTFYKLFGITLFWSRAASGLAGIATVILAYQTGKTIYNRRTGIMAGLILLTSYGFVFYSRQGMTDTMLTLCLFSSCYFYIKSFGGSKKWWYLIGISCGLAIMVKGAAGAVAPASIFFALVIDKKLTASLRSAHFWLAWLFFLIVVTPWHLSMVLIHGQRFLQEYVGYHILQRSTSALEGNSGNYLFYITELLGRFSPWIYLVPFALITPIKNKQAALKSPHILLVQAFIIFALYMFVQTKLPNYIVPLFPILALLVARFLDQTLQRFSRLNWLGLLSAVAGAVVIAQPEILWAFLGLGIIGGIFLLITKKKFSNFQVVAFTILFLLTVGFKTLRHLYGNQQSALAEISILARETNELHKPLTVFSTGKVNNPPVILFYSNRKIMNVDENNPLPLLASGSKVQFVTDVSKVVELRKSYDVKILAEIDSIVFAELQTSGEKAK